MKKKWKKKTRETTRSQSFHCVSNDSICLVCFFSKIVYYTSSNNSNFYTLIHTLINLVTKMSHKHNRTPPRPTYKTRDWSGPQKCRPTIHRRQTAARFIFHYYTRAGPIYDFIMHSSNSREFTQNVQRFYFGRRLGWRSTGSTTSFKLQSFQALGNRIL